MRYRHIKEGIRMGAKDLASPPKKNYTMGFEVEVAVDASRIPSDYEYDGDYDPFEYDYETRWDRAYDEYIEQNGYPSFKEWLIYNINEIDLQELEPKWGWYGKSFDEIISEQPNEDEIRETFKQIIPAFFNDPFLTMKKISQNKSIGEKYENIIIGLAKQFDVKIDSLKSEQLDSDTNKTNNVYDSYSFREAIKLILKKLNAEVNLHMTEKVNDTYYYVMNEDGEPISLDDIQSLEEIMEYFDTNEDDLKDLAGESYTNWADEIINTGVDEILSNETHDSSQPLGSISMLVDNYMDVSSQINGTNYKQWNIVPDGTDGVDAEITSPISSVDQSLSDLKSIFEMIEENNQWVYTTRQCGLHINIGSWTPEEVHKIDWLKFMLLVRGDRILAEFNRSNNSFAIDKLPKIVSALKGYTPDINSYFDDLMMVNKVVLEKDKYSAINFSKLFSSKPHIEVRAFGNENYHQKFDKVKEYTLRVIRALEIASDPNAYKKEYINMLYKHFGSKFFDETNQKNLDKDGSEYEKASLINKFYELWGNALPELKLSQITYFGSDFLYVVSTNCEYIQIHRDNIHTKEKYEEELESIENRITKEMVKVYLDLGNIPKNKGYKYKLKPGHIDIIKKYPKINYMIKQIMGN